MTDHRLSLSTLKIDFLPCPPEKTEAWRAGMKLLLDLMMEADHILRLNEKKKAQICAK